MNKITKVLGLFFTLVFCSGIANAELNRVKREGRDGLGLDQSESTQTKGGGLNVSGGIITSSLTVTGSSVSFNGVPLIMPPNNGDENQRLTTDGDGLLTWETGGSNQTINTSTRVVLQWETGGGLIHSTTVIPAYGSSFKRVYKSTFNVTRISFFVATKSTPGASTDSTYNIRRTTDSHISQPIGGDLVLVVDTYSVSVATSFIALPGEMYYNETSSTTSGPYDIPTGGTTVFEGFEIACSPALLCIAIP